MRKNVASQVVSARLIALADGTAVTTGTTTVYVTLSGGTQATGSGTVTHEGNGEWSYVPTQAETNSNQVSFMFTNSLSVGALVNVYPVAFDPTDSVRAGLTALPNAAAGADGGLIRLGANVATSNSFSISGATGTGFTISNGNSAISLSELTFNGGIVMIDGAASDIPFDGDELTLLKTTITRGATVLPTSGTVSTLDAAGVRTAVGLASADLDIQLGDILTQAVQATSSSDTASTNTATLLTRLSATRAGYLDNLSAGAVALQATLSTVAGYVDTEVAAIKAVTDKVDTTLELDGSVWRATTNFFDNAPSGGGGGGDTIQVLPVQAFVSDGLITSTVNGSPVNLRLSKNYTGALVFAFFNRSDNSAYSLVGKTVRFVAKNAAGAAYAKRETGGSGITIGGTDNNQATVTFNTAVTGSALGNGSYVIWIINGSTNVDGAKGALVIDDEPLDYP